MPDAGNFGLTYELLFEGESAWTDITALVDSRTTKIDVAGCSEDLKSVIGKCSFEMRYNTNPSKALHATIVGKILDAKQSLGTVRFRMGGIASFVGKIDLGSFSQRNGRIPGFPTITVEDNSYLLDEVMGASFEYPANNDLDDEGWAVFDKSNLAESIVMLRLLDAGYTIDQIDLASSDSITEKVRRVVYDADDERTYREMLDTLLYEYCAVIHTTPEGKLSVRRLYKESPVSERSVEGFLVKEGITTGGGDYAYDGVKVVWSNLSRLDGAVVYNANITMNMDDDGNREGEEIQPQHYWPEDGDIEETWQEFDATFLDREYQTKVSRLKNKDLSLISVKNAYYEVDKDAEILLANNPPEIEPTKARVLWWNSHSTDVKKLYGFTIVGDALFRSKLNESTYPADARKIDKPYETEFIYSSEAAAKLANHLHRFRKYGDLQHKWSEIGVTTPLFQVVTVSAPDTLISSLGMVISQSVTFPAPNKIKRSNSAIGITAFNSEPVKTRSIQLGGAPVNTGPAGSNGTRSVVQLILGTADGPYSDAGNVLGTDLALVGTSLALVGVDGAQWMYEAPTPDAGEYVWRREGYYTPPEVWPKVWNITRMTGASSFGITLHAASLIIPVTAGGVPYGGNITISAVFQNIPTTYEITWGIIGASFVDVGTNQTKEVDVTTAFNDSVIITVSVLFGGVTYTDMVTLTKVYDGKPAPVYAGVHDSMFYDIGGEPLQKGDCFLYMPKVGEAYDDTNPLFGHVLKWDGDSWESTTDSQSIGFAAKDAFAIARESGKVIFAAVIYTEAMVAANIQAGSGTGLAGSGFRFRAMDDDYSQEGAPKVPVFDIYNNDKQLFKVDVSNGKIYFGEHFWYDPSDGVIHTPGDNTLIRANGRLKALFAELLGTLRTGLNAPTDARVGIQDQSGIIAGPTFTGSGLNDLNITESGAVAGKFRVKIETGYPKYAVGSTGPGGGIVVSNNGITGLEVAPSSTAWSGKTQAEAASLANALVYGGQSDWRLPVRDESLTLYNQQSLFINHTEGRSYWTSTAYDSNQYYVISLGGAYGPPNNFSRIPKANPIDARAVRTFTVSADTFRVSIDDGLTYGEVITIPSSGNYAIPSKDITIKFGSVSGHTAGDYWSFEQGAMRGLAITDSGGDEYFSASDGVVNVKKTLLLSGIPTSATGLSSGSVWRDGTTLKIV